MRFLRLSLFATIVWTLGGVGTVRAAIIYSGLQDVAIPTNFDGIYLDIETGVTSSGEFAGWDINPFFGGVGVASSPSFQPARISAGNEDAIVGYAEGATIGSSLTYSVDYGGSSTHLGSGPGQFGIGDEGYLAFRLITNGGLSWNYGWMRVLFTANTGGALIRDWAYEDSGSSIVVGRVEQTPTSVGVPPVPAETGVKWTTFSPATGESFTYGSLLGDPGAGTITSVLKAGAGSTVLDANHTFTGQTMVSEGVLELAGSGRLSGTSKVTVNAGGTLFFSGPGGLDTRVNAGTPVTLNGGTLSTAGVTTSLDQQFGALTLSQDSTIDLSLLAVGNTVRFADSSAAEWAAGKTLRIFNYTIGEDHVFFGTNSSGLTSGQSGQLNAIQFYSDSGVTLIGAGSALQYLGSGEIVPSPVPEPSSLVVAAGMCGLIAWREGRTHRGRVRRAGRV